MGIYLEIILPVGIPPLQDRKKLLEAIQLLPACEAFRLSPYQAFLQRRRCRLAHFPEEDRELTALSHRVDPEHPPRVDLPPELESKWRQPWEWRVESCMGSNDEYFPVLMLDTPLEFYLEFWTCLLSVSSFGRKINVTDPRFRQDHLKLGRSLAELFGADEALYLPDSSAESSGVICMMNLDFVTLKKWLRDACGPPKADLGQLEVDLGGGGYDLEGYYLERRHAEGAWTPVANDGS
ncbi:MAG: hypothetical protein AB7S38_11305 [Vulcanimicrobiota bacterium]